MNRLNLENLCDEFLLKHIRKFKLEEIEGIEMKMKELSAEDTNGMKLLKVIKNNDQVLTDECPFGTIFQIIENWFTFIHHLFFNVKNFQRPNRISGSLSFTFKLIRFKEISHSHRIIESLLLQSNWSFVDGFASTTFSLISSMCLRPVKRVSS